MRTGPFLNFTLEFDSDEMLMGFGESTTTTSYSASFNMSLSLGRECFARLESVFANLNLSKVEYCKICITWVLPYGLDTYIDMFGSLFLRFSGLRELLIVCKYGVSSDLIAQLQPAVTLPCPLLSDLTLQSITTEDRSWIRVLEERKAAGSVLTNIKVVATSFDSEIQRELEMLAENVQMQANDVVEFDDGLA